MNAERARKPDTESRPMAAFGGHAQPSPTLAQCLNGGYGWLEVNCRRCARRGPACRWTRSDGRVIRRSGSWSRRRNVGRCWTPRYSPPVHTIRLMMEREIAPYE